MSQRGRSLYYKTLKEAGQEFDKHYRDYTVDELLELLQARGLPIPPLPEKEPRPRRDDQADLQAQLDSIAATVARLAAIVTAEPERPQPPMAAAMPTPGLNIPDPREYAGVTLNTHGEQDAIRTDEYGNVWYREEVQKPSYAKPRGRRVYKYNDPGVVKQKIDTGDGYFEEFEIGGDQRSAKPAEIRVTLPSYQTGLMKPPNLPFRVHTYAGARGYHREDVDTFFGGADLVPDTVKRTYVSTTLCYDIQSVNRTIEDEYRLRVLKTGTLR